MMGVCRIILVHIFYVASCLAVDGGLAPPGPQIRPWPLSFGQAPGNPGPPGSNRGASSRLSDVRASVPAQVHLSQPSNIFASIWAPWSTWGFCVDGRQIRVRACNTIAGFRCYGTNVESMSCEAGDVNTQHRSIFNNIFGTDATEVTGMTTLTTTKVGQLEFQHWTPAPAAKNLRPQLYPVQPGGLSWPANSNNMKPLAFTENRVPLSSSYVDSKFNYPPLNVANDAAWWSQWTEYST
uniref:Uncharacterized protein n=1 Tax=Romanomermis culicivorax TaxID=13658 RepID=A0A915KLK0_ROMCU